MVSRQTDQPNRAASRASVRRWTRHRMKMYTWGGWRGEECWLQGNDLSVNPWDLHYLQHSDSDWPQPKTDLSVCSTATRGQTLENRDKPQTPSCDTDTDGSAETWLSHNIKTTDRWREFTLIILLWKPRGIHVDVTLSRSEPDSWMLIFTTQRTQRIFY